MKKIREAIERKLNGPKKKNINPLPDVVLIDGGKLQLEVALRTFSVFDRLSTTGGVPHVVVL